jgi:hypothetical protein
MLFYIYCVGEKCKEELSLCLINYAVCHEGIWGIIHIEKSVNVRTVTCKHVLDDAQYIRPNKCMLWAMGM